MSLPIAGRRTEAATEAVERLVHEHYASVYRFCARRIGDQSAFDAAQETFLTAQKCWHKFRGESSERTWLLGIAMNQCRTIARKRKVEPLGLENWLDDPSPGDLQTDVVQREDLRRALAQLSPEHREIILLHEIEGLRYAEAARLLGVPEGTLKSRLHYAFKELRALLSVPEGAYR
jgi:RNA polymerase sigma-70 factor (ECF subfamily)